MQKEIAVKADDSNELIEAILAAYETHDNLCGGGPPHLCCIEAR
nr:hypothetical protein [Cupriavidus taiwanensis]